MRNIICAGALVLGCWMLPESAEAGEFDWRAYIKQDLVQVESDHFRIRRTEVCEAKLPDAKKPTLQITWSAEAPTSLLSRDQFVGMTQTYNTVFMIAILGATGISPDKWDEALDCKPSEPIGQVDLEVGMIFAKGGMQLVVVDNQSGTTERTAMTWNQLFL